MNQINIGIIGGAGYTGGEAIRLLINHPNVNIKFVHSRSNAGNKLHAIHTDLLGETEMTFTDQLNFDVDALMLCLGHGESKVFLAENNIPQHVKIIDLSQDFRLGEEWNGQNFTYGLPELNKENIQASSYIANPGCFATAIQLGLLPLAKKSLLNERDTIQTTGITGATGAGQKLQTSTQFNWRNNNINAYKTLTHQHLKEITRTIHHLQPTFNDKPGSQIHFVPWRGDFSRGIFITSQVTFSGTIEEANIIYKEYYKNAAFTFVSDNMIDIKQVVNTNKAFIFLEKVDNTLIIHSTIDNLVKGASGQAVHNLNLIFGFPETAGLKLKALVF